MRGGGVRSLGLSHFLSGETSEKEGRAVTWALRWANATALRRGWVPAANQPRDEGWKEGLTATEVRGSEKVVALRCCVLPHEETKE